MTQEEINTVRYLESIDRTPILQFRNRFAGLKGESAAAHWANFNDHLKSHLQWIPVNHYFREAGA